MYGANMLCRQALQKWLCVHGTSNKVLFLFFLLRTIF
uniref:Uncharacterized protein n=1 Tax=Anguilla anguilla TaxID=7936 RepID=A0A0E9TK68_ANGAN